MNLKRNLLAGILVYILCFINSYSYSQDIVKSTQRVEVQSSDAISSPGLSVEVEWLKSECLKRQKKGVNEISFQILGDQVSMNVKGNKIPTVHYNIAQLLPILNACSAQNITTLRLQIIHMSGDDVARYAQNHQDLPSGELEVKDRPNLLILIPSSLLPNTGMQTSSNMVGLDMGTICPPPPNCNSADNVD